MTRLGSHLWRLSLGVLHALGKAIYARATSKATGSEARGEGKESDNLIETNSKPPVAQRAGGISETRFCLISLLACKRTNS